MASRPKLNRVWASGNPNLRRDPGDAKYITGWVSEIPTYQVLNFLQYKVDTTFLSIVERGIAEWGSDISYAKGAISWDESDGRIYVSSVANPDKTRSPSKNPSQWTASSIQITRTQYDDLNSFIDAHIANKSNPHGLTAAQLSAYTKAEIDQIVSQYRAEVLAHKNDTNNPHKTKAVDIGAVPVTGGTYTGTVTFPNIRFAASGALIGIDNNLLNIAHKNGRIELRPSGSVLVGSSSGLSPVVTEKTFPDLRLNGQPNYAQPTPMFVWDLMHNLNLRVGSSAAAITSDNYVPTFADDGMYKNPRGETYIDVPVIYTGEMTYVADVRVNVIGNAVSRNFFSFSSGGMRVVLRTYGTANVVSVIAEMAGTLGGNSWQGLSKEVTWMPGEVKRIAIVCDKIKTTLFVNGVELGTRQFTPNSIADEDLLLRPSVGGIGSSAQVDICGFRMFGQRLSAAQVSPL